MAKKKEEKDEAILPTTIMDEKDQKTTDEKEQDKEDTIKIVYTLDGLRYSTEVLAISVEDAKQQIEDRLKKDYPGHKYTIHGDLSTR